MRLISVKWFTKLRALTPGVMSSGAEVVAARGLTRVEEKPLAIAGVIPLLTSIAQALGEVTRRTDPDFLQLGHDLRSLYTGASDLSRSITQQAAAVKDSLETYQLLGEEGLASRSLKQMHEGFAEVERNLESLVRVAASLDGLKEQGGRMERVAALLGITASSFAIESARNSEHQQAFGSFVEELRALAAKIKNLGNTISEQSEAVHRNLQGLSSSIRRDLQELDRLAEQSRGTLEQTSSEVQQLLSSSWSALEQAQVRTQNLARHADEATFQIQFGDIVRQKLEHVVTALGEASTALASPDETSIARAEYILAIQVNQMKAMQSEIQVARTQLCEAFNGIGRQTEDLVKDVGALGISASPSGGGRDLLESLSQDLVRLEEWQARGIALCAQAQTMSREAVESSAKLSQYLGQIQEINREMHLQALNAIIKAVILGDQGSTLAVLSTHVHGIFEESNRLVLATVKTLEEVQSLARSAADSGSSGQASDRSDLKGGIRQILKVREQFVLAGSSVGELAGKQASQLAATRSRLEFLAALGTDLKQLQDQLEEARSPLASGRSPGRSPVDLGDLSARYTMESEREIHRQIVGASPGAAPQAVETSSGESIEFFDEPAATAASTPPPPVKEKSRLEPAITAQSPAAPPPPTLKSTTPGDDVEFF